MTIGTHFLGEKKLGVCQQNRMPMFAEGTHAFADSLICLFDVIKATRKRGKGDYTLQFRRLGPMDAPRDYDEIHLR
jgi:hypothetical protein